MSQKKTKKRNKEIRQKKSIFVVVFLITLFLGLAGVDLFLIIGNSKTASGEEGYKPVQFNEEQTIYDRVACSNQDCSCRGVGSKLFTFLGADANCDEITSQIGQLSCFLDHSYPEYKCDSLSTEREKEECIERYSAYQITPHKYYLGKGGTFINKGDLTINGIRTYFNGYTGREHHIYTGFEKSTHNPLTLIKNSRNTFFGGDLSVADGVDIKSAYGGVFLDSQVSIGDVGHQIWVPNERDYNNDSEYGEEFSDYKKEELKNLRISGLGDFSRNTGIGADGEGYTFIRADGKDFFRFNIDKRNISIEKGVQARGDIKSDEMYLQENRLHWSKPIRGNFVLYYKKNSLDSIFDSDPNNPEDPYTGDPYTYDDVYDKERICQEFEEGVTQIDRYGTKYRLISIMKRNLPWSESRDNQIAIHVPPTILPTRTFSVSLGLSIGQHALSMRVDKKPSNHEVNYSRGDLPIRDINDLKTEKTIEFSSQSTDWQLFRSKEMGDHWFFIEHLPDTVGIYDTIFTFFLNEEETIDWCR
jgi:hypothetical protein